MLYILSIFTGMLGALCGWTVGVIAATATGNAHTMPTSFVIGSSVAGFTVAVALTLYVKGGFRSPQDIAARALAVVLMTGILAAGGLNLRNVALSHLGLITKAPAVEFEIRLPPTAANADVKREAQVELLTNLNQMLAQIDGTLAMTDGRPVLRGHVPLTFRTAERVVVLSLPGQAQRAFKLRLPPNPSRSDEFGPWHLDDRMDASDRRDTARATPDDSFAIRYRVL